MAVGVEEGLGLRGVLDPAAAQQSTDECRSVEVGDGRCVLGRGDAPFATAEAVAARSRHVALGLPAAEHEARVMSAEAH